MLLNKSQRDAIEQCAATFVEGSDDLAAICDGIENVIERRLEFIKKKKENYELRRESA